MKESKMNIFLKFLFGSLFFCISHLLQHVLRELNTLKETLIEREKMCIDQKNEIGELQKDIAQLEETNTYHKESAVEAAKRIGGIANISSSLWLSICVRRNYFVN